MKTIKLNCSKLLSLLLTMGTLGPLIACGASLEVRFYPQTLRAYEVDAAHKITGALLQNAVVMNSSEDQIVVNRVQMDLLEAGEIVQTHYLSRTDLDRLAKRGYGLQQAGLLENYSFQFRPEQLLGTKSKLAADPALDPHSAIMLGQRYFVFAGTADQLRLRVRGVRKKTQTEVEAEASIPLSAEGSKAQYVFPLAGRSFVATGQGLHQGHRWVVPEEFALDLCRVGEGGSTHRGDGSKRTDYFAYGTDVLAAADGTVRAVQSDLPESDSTLRQPGETAEAYLPRLMHAQDQLLTKGAQLAAGNYVVLEHASSEYSLYAHLVPGSIRVKSGDTVKAGRVIGQLGHSGNSSEPHLHFQVMDGPDPLMSVGLPIRFKNVSLPFADGPRAIQSGDFVDAEPIR